MQESYVIFNKSDNHTMTNAMDLHCWVINADGTLYDPEFKEYQTIQSTWECTDHKVLQPFTSGKRTECWHILWKQSILPNFKANGKKVTLDCFYNNPQYGCAPLNAYAYHVRTPGSKMKIGRMGWKRNGSPDDFHWEFG